jgi:hypothetical protein
MVINEDQLRELSAAERRQLARSLAAIDYPHPMLGFYLDRGRRVGALVSIISCTVLVGWIVILALTLHRSFHAQHWRAAWVGFDMVLLLALAATGWAFWRGRQIVIACRHLRYLAVGRLRAGRRAPPRVPDVQRRPPPDPDVRPDGAERVGRRGPRPRGLEDPAARDAPP